MPSDRGEASGAHWKANPRAAVRNGSLLLSTVYFSRKGTSTGSAVHHTGYLCAFPSGPASVNLYLSAATAAATDRVSVRVTSPHGYAAVPVNTPWILGSGAPPPPTAHLTAGSAIRRNDMYDFYVTGRTNVTYAISVIE